MARAPALFFRLELAEAIVYKFTTAFVDFNFTFLFIDSGVRPPLTAQVELRSPGHAQLHVD